MVEAAALAQLRPRLSALLAAAGALPAAGQEAGRELESFTTACRGRSRLMTAELLRILAALGAAGVQALPFKGPAFSEWTGGSSIPREMNDLDVLVEERTLRDAVAALEPLGYAPLLARQALASRWLTRVTNELPLGACTGPLLLEIHWRLSPPWFAAAVDASEVLGRAVERELFGARARCASADDLLLMHVSDGMKAYGWSLRWVGDLADILRSATAIDWTRMAATARAHGALDSVRIALALVEDAAAEAARLLEAPQVALALAPEARALAHEARTSRRLAGAVLCIRGRLAGDMVDASATRHFAWAVRVADRPDRALAGVLRHLAGPSVADLEAMPREGVPDAALRARAWRRRIAGAAR